MHVRHNFSSSCRFRQTSPPLNSKRVQSTLDLALQAALGSTPMLHSDRGFQYTSWSFKKRLEAHGLTQSMSRVGKCIDNGP